jgi:predicted ATPase
VLYYPYTHYWQRAGERAVERSAHVEAIGHLTKGLEVLQTLPDTPERTRHECLLQLALSAPLVSTQGWAAAEVERAYTRAFTLSQHLGEAHLPFPELLGLWRFYLAGGQLQTARALADQFLTLAQHAHDPVAPLVAHLAQGWSLFYCGDVASAHAHLERAMAVYDPQQHRPLGIRYGEDLGLVGLVHLALALWMLGYPDQALATAHRALALGQTLVHPHSLAFSLDWLAWLHQLRHEGPAAQAYAEAGLVLAREQGFPHFVALCTVHRGWALAVQGQGDTGITQMRQGQAAWQAMGGGLHQPYLLALLAEVYGTTGQADEGLALLTEALARMERTAERQYEAELYRLQGALLLQRAHPDARQAEACLHQALAIAHRQQARSWELRAVMSLARLWQQQGRRGEARALLAGVYGWFTEGFNTADLQEAKALLDQLVQEAP